MSGPVTVGGSDSYQESIISAINFTASKAYPDSLSRLKKLGVAEADAKLMLSEKVEKANPYHDAEGKFTTKDKASFVSTGPAFEATLKKLKAELKKTEARKRLETYWDEQKAELLNNKSKALLIRTNGQWNSLSDKEKIAIQGYTGMPDDGRDNFLYDRLNKALGRAKGDLNKVPDYIASDIEVLDGALAKGKLPEGLHLYRAMNIGHHGFPGYKSWSDETDLMNLIGHTIHDPGFASTSTDLSVANGFQNERRVILQIKAPKGSPGMWVGGRGSDEQRTEFPEEHEFVLPRGSKYVVTGVRKVKSSAGDTHTVIETQLINA